MRRGYVQVYTGNGKGKTTAALGLALRAAGAGLKVLIVQFVKKKKCSEHRVLKKFGSLITMKQHGKGFLLKRKANQSDREGARAGLEAAKEAMRSKEYDVVILDEANIAVKCGLLSADDLIEVISARPVSIELVITGRYADAKVVRAADLVTEMREVKHYRKKGVEAREGIEY